MKKQNVYKLPVSLTGLCADIDNCDPTPSVLGPLPPDEPILPGYTRYRLTDGVLVDIYMSEDDFAEWYELDELEIEERAMKLIGFVFTRLAGVTRSAFIYRCSDGSIKKIPAGIGQRR